MVAAIGAEVETGQARRHLEFDQVERVVVFEPEIEREDVAQAEACHHRRGKSPDVCDSRVLLADRDKPWFGSTDRNRLPPRAPIPMNWTGKPKPKVENPGPKPVEVPKARHVPVAELLRIADRDEIMPPKSTWFEPKLRAGLIARSLHEGDVLETLGAPERRTDGRKPQP